MVMPTASYAIWPFGRPGCEQLLEKRPTIAGTLQVLGENSKRYALDRVEMFKASLLGLPSPLPIPTPLGSTAEAMFATFAPWFSALDVLAASPNGVLGVWYESNTATGMLRWGDNPNLRIRVPANYRETAAAKFVLVQDIVTGAQIYIVPGFQDEHGNPIELYFTQGSDSNEKDDVNALRPKSDIVRFQFYGGVAEQPDLLNDWWGVVANLRPGYMKESWKGFDAASFYIIAAGSDPGVQLLQGTYLNLQRLAVDPAKGREFSVNAVFYGQPAAAHDVFGRPTTFGSNVFENFGFDDLTQEGLYSIIADPNGTDPGGTNPSGIDLSRYGAKTIHDISGLQARMNGDLQSAGFPERGVALKDVIWDVISKETNIDRLQDAVALLQGAIEGAPVYETLIGQLTFVRDQAAYLAGQLQEADAVIQVFVGSPDYTQYLSALKKRQLQLLEARTEASRMVQAASTALEVITALRDGLSTLSSGFVAQVQASDRSKDIAGIRDSAQASLQAFGQTLERLGALNPQ